MSRFVPPVWHSCAYDEAPHLVGTWCASTVDASAVNPPLVSAPRAPQRASSHRTSARQSFGIATPLGRTSRFSSPY
jgi:hypothetical protein